MTQPLSRLIAWSCAILIAAQLLLGLYALFDIQAFAELARDNLGLSVHWQTVEDWQWYAQLALTAAYVAPGLAGLYFLRRPFRNFARGELFNTANSRDLRRFATMLLVTAALRPVHMGLSSLVLSANHPPGQKFLSLGFGSNELSAVGLALVFWVVSNLLVEGNRLQAENRQFV